MKKRFLALALGTLAFGVALGGAKMSLGHQDALMVKAAAEADSKKVTFVSTTDNSTTTSIVKDGVTISVAKGTYTNPTICMLGNGKDKDYRFYGGTIVTISAGDFNVTSIVLECTGSGTANYGPGKLKFENPKEYSTNGKIGTWAGSAGSVSFTPSAQVRVTKITVTFGNAAPVEIPSLTSISAKLANPKATFFAGDKVTLSDFVIIGEKEDGSTEELAAGVVIKNDILVAGDNVIQFECLNGGKTLTCTCVVTAAAMPVYTKSTSSDDIVIGKKILIASADGKKVLGAQGGNNREAVLATPTGDTITLNSSFASLLIVPAKDGTFALYDQKEDGLLYAGSSKSNYLKTTSSFSYVNENAFANISLNGTEWSVKFTGSNKRNLLRYNLDNDIFSCYGSGQEPISIYVSDEDPVTFDTEKWAKDFNDKLGVICDSTGETALTAAKWNEAKKIFDDLSIPNKMAVKYGATDGVEMSKALKAYDFIIKTKYAALNDFLERREGTRANALMLPGATDSTTWTLVGIGAVTIAASASLLFFRRKKSN